jgi:hypothetical protein
MKPLDPEDIREIKQRVGMAWTMALTAKHNASLDERQAYAKELLDTHTTKELVEKIQAMKWEHTPWWWKGSHEQFLKHYGADDGLQETRS